MVTVFMQTLTMRVPVPIPNPILVCICNLLWLWCCRFLRLVSAAFSLLTSLVSAEMTATISWEIPFFHELAIIVLIQDLFTMDHGGPGPVQMAAHRIVLRYTVTHD